MRRFLAVSLVWTTPLFAKMASSTSTTTCPTKPDIGGRTHFRVGMLDVRGTAYESHHLMFEDYLGATAGVALSSNDDDAAQSSSPSVTFQLVPIAFQTDESIYDTVAAADLDFIFIQPAVFTCLAVERGVRPLATVINKRSIAGRVYEVNQFAGLIVTRADRDDIQSMADLRGRTTACVSINGFGSGLMQFRELIAQANVHYLQDVKQLVFMNNQPNIIHAVLRGDIDAGYIRTDQLERTVDEHTGQLVDATQLKIIDAVPDSDYPFVHSTPLYPEYTMGVFPHVPDAVAAAVRDALLGMARRAAPAAALRTCYQEACDNNDDVCRATCSAQVMADCHMDDPADLVLLADDALVAGKRSGFSEPPSFMNIRTMLETTGLLLRKSSTNIDNDQQQQDVQCIRSTNVAQAVVCPEGYIKRSDASIQTGCQQAGLDCFGFECVCNPCVQAADVDFFPYDVPEQDNSDSINTNNNNNDWEAGGGCDKFAICGQVPQQSPITFRAIDNARRHTNSNMTVHLFLDESLVDPQNDHLQNHLQIDAPQDESSFVVVYPMQRVENDLGQRWFELTVADPAVTARTGDIIMQVFEQSNEPEQAQRRQIDNSPFRLRIVPRDCATDTNDPLRVPDANGNCVCQSQSVLLGRKCVALSVLLPSVLVPLVVVVAAGLYLFLGFKKNQMDLIWKVRPEELTYKDRVLGRGTFGMVLLAEYRGTQVAVKRALPPDERTKTVTTTTTTGQNTHPHSTAAHRFDFIDGTQSSMRMSQSHHKPDPESGLPDNFGAKSMLPGMKSFAMGLGSSSASTTKKTLASGIRSKTSSSNKSGSRSRFFKSLDSKQYERLKEEFKCEMRMLSKVRHPCITTIMGAVLDKTSEPLMIMEYMEMGSLYDLLHNESMVLEGDKLLPILQDIARGMRFLHAAKPQIIHGDLKAANVLVDSRFRAKVADFGLSTKRNYHNAAVGTPFWMAPELLRKESPNTAQSDVYSFGVVLWEVLTRKDPYEGENHREVLLNVANPQIQKRPDVSKSCPPVFAQLLQDCWLESPTGRPTAEAIDGRLKLINSTEVFSMNSRINQKANPESPTRGGGDASSNWSSFPQRIAQALQRGERVEPETIDSVTVFFAEIVGLAEWSKTLSSETLLGMLDRLHLKLDTLCEQYGVLHIDTIGDVYMVVANANLDQNEHHADTMARFAVKVMEETSEILLDPSNSLLGHVPLRAGMHVGPIATHVLGLRHPKFSIVGETVSTAALMARRSHPGRIQCSDEASQVLSVHRRHSSSRKMEYVIKPRGEITVKGQKMATHWIQSLFFRGSNHLAAVSEEDLVDTESSEGTNRGVRVSFVGTEHTEDLTYQGSFTNLSDGDLSSSGRGSRRELLAPVYDYLKTIPQSP